MAVPKDVLKQDPNALAYTLSGCRIIVTSRAAFFGLLHVEVSRIDRDRLPTLKEIQEVCEKVEEIDVPMAVYFDPAGTGTVQGIKGMFIAGSAVTRKSKAVHLWQLRLPKPPEDADTEETPED
jgi:hypothetical protein